MSACNPACATGERCTAAGTCERDSLPDAAMDHADASIDSGVDVPDTTTVFDVANDEPTLDVVTDAPAPDSGTIAAPRPVSPLSGTTVTVRQPTLRWALPMGVTEASVELCRDRACTMVIATLMGRDRAALTTDLPAGWVFWRVRGRRGTTTGTTTSATWQFRVGPRSAAVERSYGSVLDLNGDGYRDVAIGAPGASVGAIRDSGSVRIYMGSASGLAGTASRVIDGTEGGERLGNCVASLGDINGDGFVDLGIGALDGSRSGRGSLKVYLGGPSGVATTSSQRFEGANMSEAFGWTIVPVGDINGDGYADVGVGTLQGGSSGRGSVLFYTGSQTGLNAMPITVLDGATFGNGFGSKIGALGDIDGDGYADVAVGFRVAGTGDESRSGIPVFFGREDGYRTTPSMMLRTPTMLSIGRFGTGIAAGDWNGDGLTDVMVGSPVENRAYLYFSDSGSLPATPVTSLMGGSGFRNFGSAASSFSDLDGDGFGDLAIGGDTDNLMHVYYGRSGSMPLMGVTIGAPMLAPFGAWVSGSGDTNGDGFDELVLGVPDLMNMGRNGFGAVYVYEGSTSGLRLPAARAYEGTTEFGRLGEGLY
ncbi:MAG: FG-GAP repeat protein [Myxococcales bacterium]|nr:FG-GAP repeat protein [Myxococcales bacterium]